jgi:hypothetical protein
MGIPAYENAPGNAYGHVDELVVGRIFGYPILRSMRFGIGNKKRRYFLRQQVLHISVGKTEFFI